jgi:tetratricopeptide (TPR) repeat protein
MKTTLLLSGSAAFALASFWIADPAPTQAAEAALQPSAARPIADAPLAGFRWRLLDLAFEAASALPAHPHIKTRSRAQEDVVQACLELGQLRSAQGYVERIGNWRKGSASADLARLLVEQGALDEARKYLATSQEIADKLDYALVNEMEDEGIESPQDWQRDQIRVKIAQALALHGEDAKADELEAGVVEAEAGRVDLVRARRASLEDFEVLMPELEELIPGSSFDRARNALEVCAALFDRFYGDPARRARIEAALRAPNAKLPEDVRIASLRRAAEVALDHQNPEHALQFVLAADARVKGVCAGAGWMPEHEIPLRAALAGLRHRCGDRPGAEAEMAAAVALYEAQRANIVEIYRAGALRPLAEAAMSMGDAAAALAFYRRAIEEGAVNVNARPRVEDLVATCLSMAREAIEPDEASWQRIRAIRAELKAPW